MESLSLDCTLKMKFSRGEEFDVCDKDEMTEVTFIVRSRRNLFTQINSRIYDVKRMVM